MVEIQQKENELGVALIECQSYTRGIEIVGDAQDKVERTHVDADWLKDALHVLVVKVSLAVLRYRHRDALLAIVVVRLDRAENGLLQQREVGRRAAHRVEYDAPLGLGHLVLEHHAAERSVEPLGLVVGSDRVANVVQETNEREQELGVLARVELRDRLEGLGYVIEQRDCELHDAQAVVGAVRHEARRIGARLVLEHLYDREQEGVAAGAHRVRARDRRQRVDEACHQHAAIVADELENEAVGGRGDGLGGARIEAQRVRELVELAHVAASEARSMVRERDVGPVVAVVKVRVLVHGRLGLPAHGVDRDARVRAAHCRLDLVRPYTQQLGGARDRRLVQELAMELAGVPQTHLLHLRQLDGAGIARSHVAEEEEEGLGPLELLDDDEELDVVVGWNIEARAWYRRKPRCRPMSICRGIECQRHDQHKHREQEHESPT